MPPCCGQAAGGYERVWQHIVDGKVVDTSTDQATINAKLKAAGRGRVQQVYVRQKSSSP